MHQKLPWKFGMVLCLLIGAGCSSKRNLAHKLPPFSITNEVVGGEVRQVIQMTNGVSLYFTRSDLVAWFGEGSAINVEYDPKTLKPLNVLLKTPGSNGQSAASILDFNADGVPEFRQINGQTNKEILYRGEWYPVTRGKGRTGLITIDGKEMEVRYDGRRWIKS